MDLRFPGSTPRVSRSDVLYPTDLVVIDGAQFEDGLRRLVVGSDVSDESMVVLQRVLSDERDAPMRWSCVHGCNAPTAVCLVDHRAP
jgi:hypothetical protein